MCIYFRTSFLILTSKSTVSKNHIPSIKIYMIWGTVLVAQMVKNLPATQETQVQSLGWKIPWRRKWQPTPVFLPGELHGQRSLAGYSPWGHKDSDMTERLCFFHLMLNHECSQHG